MWVSVGLTEYVSRFVGDSVLQLVAVPSSHSQLLSGLLWPKYSTFAVHLQWPDCDRNSVSCESEAF